MTLLQHLLQVFFNKYRIPYGSYYVYIDVLTGCLTVIGSMEEVCMSSLSTYTPQQINL